MITINTERFLRLMDAQAEIGRTPEGGVSRPALSQADVEVRQWLEAQIKAQGLDYRIDGAGNQFARLLCAAPNAQTLLIGSHLDSVPDGGRFDGALGVIVALETVLSLKEANVNLPFHVEMVNFTDEEGALTGLMGSRALIGDLDRAMLESPRGGRETLAAGMARIGITDESILGAKRDPATLRGYLEVHIEQGTRLIDAGIDVGVVNSVVGIRSAWLAFHGEAGHAGTTPMDKRRDAFWGAVDFVRSARDMIARDFAPGVVNFGMVEVRPGAFNVIPDTAKLSVEFRHGDLTQFDGMEIALRDLAQQTADAHGLSITYTPVGAIPPAPMSATFIDAIERATNALGLSHTRLMSFAGHDAQSLTAVTDSVMFFVPSVNGISHNPAEYTTPEDCVNAANVMLQTVLQLAQTE